jgi:hypothetical protein
VLLGAPGGIRPRSDFQGYRQLATPCYPSDAGARPSQAECSRFEPNVPLRKAKQSPVSCSSSARIACTGSIGPLADPEPEEPKLHATKRIAETAGQQSPSDPCCEPSVTLVRRRQCPIIQGRPWAACGRGAGVGSCFSRLTTRRGSLPAVGRAPRPMATTDNMRGARRLHEGQRSGEDACWMGRDASKPPQAGHSNS